MNTLSEWWMWASFSLVVLCLLTFDMMLLKTKGTHRVTYKEALSWVGVWVFAAFIFNLSLWRYWKNTIGFEVATKKSLEFLTGYLIEESLSVDNMFVFVLIFSFFKVPAEYQRRVLLYGVLGAIVMRLIMILLGVWLVTRFHWILYIFGVFLIFTGFKMLLVANENQNFNQNRIILWMQTHLRVTQDFFKDKFFIFKNGLWYLTPLFLVLVLIELSDLVFALDSIPAIFAITNDPFIIFTSNIFAILGLRALYFLLANMIEQFHFLKFGLAFILILIGLKMLIAYWYKIPIGYALLAVLFILIMSILFSLIKRPH